MVIRRSESLVKGVREEVEGEVGEVGGKEIGSGWLGGRKVILVKNMDEGVEMRKEYGGEEVIMERKE